MAGLTLPRLPSRFTRETSDVAAFDLLGQGLDQTRDLVQMRVDSQRLAERLERPLVVAKILHDHAEPSQRAEMAGFTNQHLLDIRERAAVIVAQVVERRAPVPGLDIVGPQLDRGVEQLERDVALLRVDRG